VRHFCDLAFGHVGITLEWKGTGVDEKAYDTKTGKVLIEIDPRYFRPTEVDLLVGDPTKAHQKLGWKHKHTLQQLVTDMVAADVELFKRDRYLMEGGHKVMNYHE